MWLLCRGHLLPLPKIALMLKNSVCVEESHDKSNYLFNLHYYFIFKRENNRELSIKEFYSLKQQQQMLMPAVTLFLSFFPVPYSSRKIPQPCNYSLQVDH
jgi:hypothetical protein